MGLGKAAADCLPARQPATAATLTLDSLGKAGAGTRATGLEGEALGEAKSLGETNASLATGEGARSGSEVESHGGSLAEAGLGEDLPRAPASQALAGGPSGAPATLHWTKRVLSGRAAEDGFRKWVLAQSADKQADIMRSYDALKAHEAEWLAIVGGAAHPRQAKAVRKRTATNLRDRLSTGKAFLEWRAAAGAMSRSPLKDAWVLSYKSPLLHGSRSSGAMGRFVESSGGFRPHRGRCRFTWGGGVD